MDLFELVFVLLFLLVPLLDALRKGKSEGPKDGSPSEGPEVGAEEEPAAARGRTPPQSHERTPGHGQGSAAEMLPDDLWEVLTGERRTRTPAPPAPGHEEAEAPWSTDSTASDESSWDQDSGWEPEPGEVGWREIGDEEESPGREAVSLEYEGPEAYSLETPPPPPEVRHAAFHERIDRTSEPAPPARPRRSRTLVGALRTRGGLRQGILLSEILGQPKGLE